MAFRTNFIVGFPGETDAHFETLLRFVEEERFDHLVVFSYEREPETPFVRDDAARAAHAAATAPRAAARAAAAAVGGATESVASASV